MPSGDDECSAIPPEEVTLKTHSDFYPVNSRGKALDTFQKTVEKGLTQLALGSGSRAHVFNDNLSSEELLRSNHLVRSQL